MTEANQNPFESPRTELEAQPPKRGPRISSLSQSILFGVFAWTPACIVSFIVTVFLVRWLNPGFVFYGGLVVLFWMCAVGTVLAFVTGYLVFLPLMILAGRNRFPIWLLNLLTASILVYTMPTVVLSLMDGQWQTEHGFTPWCLPPAYLCCGVFQMHQFIAARKNKVDAIEDGVAR